MTRTDGPAVTEVARRLRSLGPTGLRIGGAVNRRTRALERIADALETLAVDDSPLEALCTHVERVAGAIDNFDASTLAGVERELRGVVDSLDRLHRQGERR